MRLMDRLPLPSKLPMRLVCHWAKGSVRLVLCKSIHTPPAVPFAADRESEPLLTLMCVMCGDEGATLPTTICPEPVATLEPFCNVQVVGKFAG